MKQTVADPDAVVFECDLPEPRDKVWRALTERDLLAAWLMPNDIRPEVGVEFELQPVPETGAGRPVVECEVLEVEPRRKLRWRQQEPVDAVSSRYCVESVVSFELADLPDGGTHLRVVHDGFTTVARRATVLCFRPRTKAAITSVSCCLRRAA